MLHTVQSVKPRCSAKTEKIRLRRATFRPRLSQKPWSSGRHSLIQRFAIVPPSFPKGDYSEDPRRGALRTFTLCDGARVTCDSPLKYAMHRPHRRNVLETR